MSVSKRTTTLSGIAAMVLAMLLLPLVDSLSKLLSTTYSAEQITWARNTVHALVILPLCLCQWRKGNLQFTQSWLHLVRGVAFVLMTLSYIVALSYMPLADALAIVFLFPLIVVVLSYSWLGSRWNTRPGWQSYSDSLGFAW